MGPACPVLLSKYHPIPRTELSLEEFAEIEVGEAVAVAGPEGVMLAEQLFPLRTIAHEHHQKVIAAGREHGSERS